MMIEAHFDGACAPVNPGGTPAYGITIYRDGKKLLEVGHVISPDEYDYPTHEGEELWERPVPTSNVAEYCAVKAILDYLVKHDLTREQVVLIGDSRLVIEQLFGTWKIHEGQYVGVAKECQRMLFQFFAIKGKWVRREQNARADSLAKRALRNAGVGGVD